MFLFEHLPEDIQPRRKKIRKRKQFSKFKIESRNVGLENLLFLILIFSAVIRIRIQSLNLEFRNLILFF